MKNKRFFISFFSIFLLFTSCKTEEYDYIYTVSNMLKEELPVVINYRIQDEEKPKSDTLLYGETLQIAKRIGITSEKIWDVETSVTMFKIENLKISLLDQSRTSEELCYRKEWKGPSEIDGVGEYRLEVRESTLSLAKKHGYVYKVINMFDEDLDIDTYFQETNKGKTETFVPAKGSEIIATAELYMFEDMFIGQPKYKIQSISALKSISFNHGTHHKILNLQKDTAYINAGKDTCYITITPEMFD